MQDADKTLDSIRRDNMYLLMELAGNNVTKLSKMSDINRSTISSLLNGRIISEKLARKMELAFGKPFGWLDKGHVIEESPEYEKVVVMATFNCIQSVKRICDLFASLNAEGKTDLFDKLYRVFTDPAARDLAPSTLFTVIEGIGNDKKSNTDTKAGNKS